jgi:adenine/guanine phosphoribosyltransferase-like PRPP-binding protein
MTYAHIYAPPHTRCVFDPAKFPIVIDWAVSVIRGRYDAVAASGHSGLIVAGAVSYILQIPVIAVRKLCDKAKGDSTRLNAVLTKAPSTYAFIDDLIGSGETFFRVIDTIEDRFGKDAVLGGILLYEQSYASATARLEDFCQHRDLKWQLHVRPPEGL